MTAEEFWTKVQTTDECWLWTGSHTADGYGNLRWGGRYTYAHRVSYQLAVGPIPSGLVIDHLCRNRGCVRPDHLEPVKQAENVRRGAASFAFHGTCISGRHDLTSESLRPTQNGYTTCRQCGLENQRAGYQAMKSAAARLGVPITHLISRYGKSVGASERALQELA